MPRSSVGYWPPFEDRDGSGAGAPRGGERLGDADGLRDGDRRPALRGHRRVAGGDRARSRSQSRRRRCDAGLPTGVRHAEPSRRDRESGGRAADGPRTGGTAVYMPARILGISGATFAQHFGRLCRDPDTRSRPTLLRCRHRRWLGSCAGAYARSGIRERRRWSVLVREARASSGLIAARWSTVEPATPPPPRTFPPVADWMRARARRVECNPGRFDRQ